MERSQIVTFIRTVPIFVELDNDQLERLAHATEERSFDRGEVLIDHESPSNDMLIVVEGELQALLKQKHLEGEVELARLYPGDYFGVSSFFNGALHHASVKALAPGRGLLLRKESVDELFDSSPSFARAICRSLSLSVTQGLEKIPALPLVKIDSYRDASGASSVLPKRIAKTCQSIVLERDEHSAKVGMVDPHDTRSRSFLASVLKDYQVEFLAITEEDFERFSARYLEERSIAEETEPAGPLTFINAQGDAEPIAETSEQDMLPKLLTEAIRNDASDIHIEPGIPTGRVRLRLDGRLITVRDGVPTAVFRQIVTRIKVMSDMNITNVRRPQDGRFVVMMGDERAEFRASVLPCNGGEKIVLRINAPDEYLSKVSNLVVFDQVVRFMEDLLANPSGLVLVTGPTGAGKTTTLYAALNYLNNLDLGRNIVTIEDPIEYNLPYANQAQVNRELNLSFAEILRSVLRQDPDIILVGEMRDAESAAIAVEAASTGHLVLSTLHTHSAIETIARLRNLQVRPYLLADALRGIVSQRLVSRLVPGSTVSVAPEDPVRDRLRELGVLPLEGHIDLQRGQQTKDAPNDGEAGRVAVYEVLSVNRNLRDLIEKSATQAELEKEINDDNSVSLARYSRMLLQSGMVSPDRIAEIFPRRPHMQA